MTETNNTLPSKSNGRKILLGMAAIFVLPFTIAATLHLLNVHPSSHSYGNLINPPKALQLPALQDAQGKPFGTQQWLKKWSMVTIAANCAAPCQAQVHLLKQIQTSLDKDIKRVQRVLIMPTAIKPDALSVLQKQYPDLVILAGDDAETAKLAAQFKAADGSIFLVDPLGNLMMQYPQDLNPKGMQTDLKKLLKNSWAG